MIFFINLKKQNFGLPSRNIFSKSVSSLLDCQLKRRQTIDVNRKYPHWKLVWVEQAFVASDRIFELSQWSSINELDSRILRRTRAETFLEN